MPEGKEIIYVILGGFVCLGILLQGCMKLFGSKENLLKEQKDNKMPIIAVRLFGALLSVVGLVGVLFCIGLIFDYDPTSKDVLLDHGSGQRAFNKYINQTDIVEKVKKDRIKRDPTATNGGFAIWLFGEGHEKLCKKRFSSGGVADPAYRMLGAVQRDWNKVSTILLMELRHSGDETHMLGRSNGGATSYQNSEIPIYSVNCWIIDKTTNNVVGYNEFAPGPQIITDAPKEMSFRSIKLAIDWASKPAGKAKEK
jgi:hypothetical protein